MIRSTHFRADFILSRDKKGFSFTSLSDAGREERRVTPWPLYAAVGHLRIDAGTGIPPPRFARRNMYPSYLNLDLRNLHRRIEQARETVDSCGLCPRRCGANRSSQAQPTSGIKPFCGVADNAVVSSFFPHLGEEDCLRGTRGSGTIFFSGCNLKCAFCQNHEISHRLDGEVVSSETLAGMMLRLQDLGCHNINWVTPTHVLPHLLDALVWAVESGLRLPIVYNTHAYDLASSLRLLDGIVDIYMPDFKFWDATDCKRFLKAPDYPEVAREAHREMFRQVGCLVLDPDTGLAIRGMLVRHLVMPGRIAQTAHICRFLAEELSPDTYVNLMGQYRPCHLAYRYPEIARRPTRGEMAGAFDEARKAGLTRFDQVID